MGPALLDILIDSMLTRFVDPTKFQGIAGMMADTRQLILANWKDGPTLKDLNLTGVNLKVLYLGSKSIAQVQNVEDLAWQEFMRKKDQRSFS